MFLTTARDDGATRVADRVQPHGRQGAVGDVRPAGRRRGVHDKNGYASATPATDGQRVYASFGRHGLVAVRPDRQARVASQASASSTTITARPGRRCSTRTASSCTRIRTPPRLADRRSSPPSTRRRASTLWQTRVRKPSAGARRSSSMPATRDELVVSGQRRVAAYDPDTGGELWTVRGNDLRSDPDTGRRPRTGVRLVGAGRSDDGHSSGRNG